MDISNLKFKFSFFSPFSFSLHFLVGGKRKSQVQDSIRKSLASLFMYIVMLWNIDNVEGVIVSIFLGPFIAGNDKEKKAPPFVVLVPPLAGYIFLGKLCLDYHDSKLKYL